MMDECQYCQNNHFISSRIGTTETTFEISVEGIPCIIFRVSEPGRYNYLATGINIKSCPMCGRRLDNGN